MRRRRAALLRQSAFGCFAPLFEVQLRLGPIARVKSSAAKSAFRREQVPRSMLALSAGVMVCPLALTKDGVETQSRSR